MATAWGIWVALLLWGGFWSVLCVGLCAGRVATAPRVLARAAVACGLHAFALALPPWYTWFWWVGFEPPFNWSNPLYHPIDWTGKVAALLVSGLLVYGLKWAPPAEAGLRWPRPQPWRLVGAVVGLVAVALLGEAYLSRHTFPNLWWHEQVYVALVPGLEEELFYRGALLALLSQVFPRTILLPGARTSWGGVVSVVLFVLSHGIRFPMHSLMGFFRPYGWLSLLGLLHFSATDVLFQLAMGALFLWVRERTGSVWSAVGTHCLANTCLVLGHTLG